MISYFKIVQIEKKELTGSLKSLRTLLCFSYIVINIHLAAVLPGVRIVERLSHSAAQYIIEQSKWIPVGIQGSPDKSAFVSKVNDEIIIFPMNLFDILSLYLMSRE